MSIETCIARAIQSDLDIVEALPEIHDLPMEDLETFVDRYVTTVHEKLSSVIKMKGEEYLRSRDAAGLCATCLESGVTIPPRMLLRMCQTIIQLNQVQSEFILDTPDGASLYFVKVVLA